MYGPLRDIFISVLGYPPSNVDIDTLGDEGRPDLTVNAPSGILNADGTSRNGSWIVVEAKDEPGCFLDPDSREAIFAVKEKYVGPHTAWFVMVDPLCFVFRPVTGLVHTGDADIVIEIAGLTEAQFRIRCQQLLFELAGVSAQLERFRQGDPKMIAVDRLSASSKSPSLKESNQVRLNRKRFFDQIREATQQLQESVAMTLGRLRPEIDAFQRDANAFWAEFRLPEYGDRFDRHSLVLAGRPQGPTEAKRCDREAARLSRVFATNPHIARLAVTGLTDFQARTGVDDQDRDELFAIETANLVLARVLLIRFFEDHGFFGETRFVCNGGIDAFQKMRSYFKASYAKLLEQAYAEGSRLYASAFADTELDWIFGAKDSVLSNSIEWTLFRFARYDFTTVRGDILTGIYDRFMNRDQRKKLGEFYTPPSIARYIVERTGIGPKSRVFDPACGSGTFLIESYQAIVGHDLERGAAVYEDVLEAFDRIAGNDLNTFSSVIAQIQLLWQVLPLRNAIEQRQRFPDIRISSKVNSLVQYDHFGSLDRFAELDVADYDAVIGNPPYIRAERSAQALDPRSEMEFQRDRHGHKGVSAKLNAYALFLYRALDRWCKPAGPDGKAGLVAFVLPVSLFDSNDTATLRSLFQVGGRWTIREIVDLEVIYRQVFDADVLPAIFIAENRPARAEDTVSVRFADPKCVTINSSNALPEFDLHGLPESLIPYNDLFSPDGRILTRLTPDRLKIVQTLRENQTFGDIAKPYWVRREQARIVEWVDRQPEEPGWEERRMLARGVVFRGSKHTMKSGLSIYKGENIIAAELQGEASLKNADVSQADDASLWKYHNILPKSGLAVAQVAHCANALQFDPGKIAFSDTATILFPRDSLASVPLDLILLSNIYVWFYALAVRMGVLRTLRSHIYPTNLALLPWNDRLAAAAPKIEAMRSHIVTSCRSRLASTDALHTALKQLDLQTFRTLLRKDTGARVLWAEGIGGGEQKTLIDRPSLAAVGDRWRVTFGPGLFDWLECNRRELAEGMALALAHRVGEDLDKAAMLNLKLPADATEVALWESTVARYQEPVLEEAMRSALADLDTLVGTALGLTASQVRFIQDDLKNDAFLRGIRPRYPGTVTRKQGFRVGLDASDRYA
jgi:hypothetical protein